MDPSGEGVASVRGLIWLEMWADDGTRVGRFNLTKVMVSHHQRWTLENEFPEVRAKIDVIAMSGWTFGTE